MRTVYLVFDLDFDFCLFPSHLVDIIFLIRCSFFGCCKTSLMKVNWFNCGRKTAAKCVQYIQPEWIIYIGNDFEFWIVSYVAILCFFITLAKPTAKPISLCKNGVRQRIQVHFKSNWMNWIFFDLFLELISKTVVPFSHFFLLGFFQFVYYRCVCECSIDIYFEFRPPRTTKAYTHT